MKLHSLVVCSRPLSSLRGLWRATIVLWAVVLLGTAPGAAAESGASWNHRYWVCRIDGDDVRIEHRRRLTVHDASGERYAEEWFGEDRLRKLKKVEITVTGNDGRVIRKLSKDDLTRECGFGAGYQLYSDICHFGYRPAVTSYPVTIDYHVVQELESPFLLSGVQVQQGIPVGRAVCSLRCDDDAPLRYKSYGMGEPDVDSTHGDRWLVWQFDSLSPIDKDTIASHLISLAGSIAFCVDKFKFAGAEYSGGGWRGIARCYAQLTEGRYDDRLDADSVATEGRALVRSVYDRVRQENRYVSVSIGTGGWRPRKASSVVETRYGDCKDLSTLLISRLRSAGIEAGPALILTRSEGYLDTEFPSFGFNHVIATAVVDTDTIWMDPTCDLCPLGHLPWTDQATHALMVNEAGGDFVPTPTSTAEDNRVVRTAELQVGEDRRIRMVAHLEFHGQRALSYRRSLVRMDNEEVAQLFLSTLNGGAGSWELGDVSVDQLEDVYAPLVVELGAESRRPCRELGGVLYVDGRVFESGGGYGGQDLVGRSRSVRLYYPTMTIDSVRLRLDRSLSYDSVVVPESRYDSTNVAHSWLQRTGDSAMIAIVHGEVYDSLEIGADRFGALNEFESRLLDRNRLLFKVYRH